MDNDNNSVYTTNTLNTSYTIIQGESDLRCTWLDTCIHYMFCCLCSCCYTEDDD